MRVTWQGTFLCTVTGTFLHTVYGTFSITHSLTYLVQGTVLHTVWVLHTLRVHIWSGSRQHTMCQRGRATALQVHGSKLQSPQLPAPAHSLPHSRSMLMCRRPFLQ